MSATATPAGDQLEQDVTRLLAYSVEIALPGVTRKAARSLVLRSGDVRIAERKLRDRRDRLGRQIERQVDDAWLESETLKARDNDNNNATDRTRDLAAIRARLTIMQRLDLAIREASAMAALSTPDFVAGGTGGSDGTRVLPPGGDQDLAEHYGHLLTLITRAFEQELDRARYGGRAETKDERAARVVRDYPGLPPHVVATLDRTCGSPDTVERDRHYKGVRKINGLPAPAETIVEPSDVFVVDIDDGTAAGTAIARTRRTP